MPWRRADPRCGLSAYLLSASSRSSNILWLCLPCLPAGPWEPSCCCWWCCSRLQLCQQEVQKLLREVRGDEEPQAAGSILRSSKLLYVHEDNGQSHLFTVQFFQSLQWDNTFCPVNIRLQLAARYPLNLKVQPATWWGNIVTWPCVKGES